MLIDGVLSVWTVEASCHWAEVTMALSLVSPEVCRGQGESLTAVRGSEVCHQNCTVLRLYRAVHKLYTSETTTCVEEINSTSSVSGKDVFY